MYPQIKYFFFFMCLAACVSHNKNDEEVHSIPGQFVMLTKHSAWVNMTSPIDEYYLKHKFKLLYFFRTSHHQSLQELKSIKTILSRHPELMLIGIHCPKFPYEKSNEHLRTLLQLNEIDFPIINDADLNMWNDLALRNWPSVVLVLPNGEVGGKFSRIPDAETLERFVQEKSTPFIHSKSIDTSDISTEIKLIKYIEPNIIQKPTGLAYHSKLHTLFIVDELRHRVIAADTSGNILYTIGNGISGHQYGRFELCQFDHPTSLYLDELTNKLYIIETENNYIQEANLNTRTVSPWLEGTKVNIIDYLQQKKKNTIILPTAMCRWYDDYIIAGSGNHQWFSYNQSNNLYKQFLGNGNEALTDSIYDLSGISSTTKIEKHNRNLYFIETESSSLRVFDGKKISTLIGLGMFENGNRDGLKNKALMQAPASFTILNNNIYITDSYNGTIRIYHLIDSTLTTVNDSGLLKNALPSGITNDGSTVYFTELISGCIYKYHPQSNKFEFLRLHGFNKIITDEPGIENQTKELLIYIKPGLGMLHFNFDSSKATQIMEDTYNLTQAKFSTNIVGKIVTSNTYSFEVPYQSLKDSDELDINYKLLIYQPALGKTSTKKHKIKYILKTSNNPLLYNQPVTLPLN